MQYDREAFAYAINRAGYEEEAYGYLDFYMGSFLHTDELIDLSASYAAVFTFLKAGSFDWAYSVPAIYTFHPDPDKAPDKDESIDNLIEDVNAEMAAAVLRDE